MRSELLHLSYTGVDWGRYEQAVTDQNALAVLMQRGYFSIVGPKSLDSELTEAVNEGAEVSAARTISIIKICHTR